MLSNSMIDIAIGLILLYLVLSMLATVINEFIATQLKLRASTLKDGLEHILDDPNLRTAFYNNGLIATGNNAVSGDHVSYISGRTFALAVLGSLDPSKPVPAFADIENAVKAMPDSNIRDRLLAQLATAGSDVEKLRDNLARSFDNMMDRVSGIYKRFLKWISLGVGMVLAFAINADTIAVGSALWNDASLRAQMVQTASSFKAPESSTGNVDVTGLTDAIKKSETDLRPVPIGWYDKTIPSNPLLWLLKLVGLLLTGFAISLGAPFWFDLLSKFMNLRGAGPPPARTPAASSP
jgi:hypothetical protein